MTLDHLDEQDKRTAKRNLTGNGLDPRYPLNSARARGVSMMIPRRRTIVPSAKVGPMPESTFQATARIDRTDHPVAFMIRLDFLQQNRYGLSIEGNLYYTPKIGNSTTIGFHHDLHAV